MPLLTDADPLGVDTFAAHRIGLDEAPAAYRAFAVKRDGHVKVQLKPRADAVLAVVNERGTRRGSREVPRSSGSCQLSVSSKIRLPQLAFPSPLFGTYWVASQTLFVPGMIWPLE